MGNRYFLPAILVAFALGMGALYALRLNKSTADTKALWVRQTTELAELREMVQIRQATLASRKAAAMPAYESLQLWRPLLGAERDGNLFLRDAMEAGAGETVSVQERRSGQIEFPWNGESRPFFFAEATGVSSEFYRLMNWLGAIESKWPSARFETLDLSQTENAIRLSLRVSIPTFTASAPGSKK